MRPRPSSRPPKAVFERLRDLATDKARAAGKPAYTVFTDATLRDLAKRMPADETGLRAVTGIGPSKLEQYGDELLALLAELATEAAVTSSNLPSPPPPRTCRRHLLEPATRTCRDRRDVAAGSERLPQVPTRRRTSAAVAAAVVDDAAVAQGDAAVDPLDEVRVVGGDHEGRRRRRGPRRAAPSSAARPGGVEADERLVDQQQRERPHQADGEPRLLAQAAAEAGGQVVDPVGEPEAADELVDVGVGTAAPCMAVTYSRCSRTERSS